MSQIEAVLRTARGRGRKTLVPFLTGGYPNRDTFVRLLSEAQSWGADAVEVGIPFSDPSADGPVIQRASERALAGGATVRSILEDVATARAGGLSVPLLFMTYYNPILAFGGRAFAEAARSAGADGVLVVDLPPEEAGEFVPLARETGLETVFLVAPTTPVRRVAKVVQWCRGFVYCVSVTGVTGEKRPVAQVVGDVVGRIRNQTDLPVLAGFGVTDPDSARAVAEIADGVIIGSALLREIDAAEQHRESRAKEFMRAIRVALDQTR